MIDSGGFGRPSFISAATFQHARPLPDGQSNARPAFDFDLEQHTGPIEIAARVEHALDPAVLGPLLDLVIVAIVRDQRLVGLIVRPLVRVLRRRTPVIASRGHADDAAA
jgi:hypothetical protein